MKQNNSGGKVREQRLHVGMRIIKTVIAVFICGLLGYLRNESAFYAMITAVICMQNSTGKTFESSVNRALGTLIGGVTGVVVVYVLDALGVLYIELLRYFVLALMLIPIIEFTLLIKRPGISAFACIVFLCVTVNHSVGDTPAIYAIQRTFETLVGVGIACVIDVLLPYRQSAAQPEQEAPGPLPQEAPPAPQDAPEDVPDAPPAEEEDRA